MNIFGTFVTYCIMVINPNNIYFPKLYEVMEYRPDEIISYQVIEVDKNKVCQYFACQNPWIIDTKCYED